MMQILIDNLWVVSFCEKPSTYYMIRSYIKNWPDSMLYEDKFNFQMQFQFPTMYLDK